MVTCWSIEFRRLRSRHDWLFWLILCLFFTFLLLPYLAKEAFSTSLSLGNFVYLGLFLAISFGWILNHPLALMLVYLGCILSGQVMTLLSVAKEEVAKGNVAGAVILAGLGVCLLAWANWMKRGGNLR